MTSLVFETANVDGKSNLDKLLEETRAHVIFVQEHGISEAAVGDTKWQLLSKGWKAFIVPARGTIKGGLSSGVMIIVRKDIDAWAPFE